MTIDFESYAEEDFCYFTTVGRVTGRPHEIEIWFAIKAGDWIPFARLPDQSDMQGFQIEKATDEAFQAVCVEFSGNIRGHRSRWCAGLFESELDEACFEGTRIDGGRGGSCDDWSAVHLAEFVIPRMLT